MVLFICFHEVLVVNTLLPGIGPILWQLESAHASSGFQEFGNLVLLIILLPGMQFGHMEILG